MTNFVVEVDVARPAEEAAREVRAHIAEHLPGVRYGGAAQLAGTVRLVARSGPGGGNPLVRVKFRYRKYAARFVEAWYEEVDSGFVQSQIQELQSSWD